MIKRFAEYRRFNECISYLENLFQTFSTAYFHVGVVKRISQYVGPHRFTRYERRFTVTLSLFK